MAETAPPTENVPIFNPIYWTINNGKEINVDYLDANYLKFPISQSAPEIFSAGLTTENDILFSNAVAGNREIVNVENIRMSQGGAGYIEFPDGTQQTTASGGAGFVSNPMSANLDGGNFDITNVDDLTTTNLNVSNRFNNTIPQDYSNIGTITAGNTYIFADVVKVGAEGNIMFLLRALENGFRQECLCEIMGMADRGTIRVINNVCESDNIPIVNITYGEKPTDPTTNILTFECGITSSIADITIYQLGQGDLTAGQQFIPRTNYATTSVPTTIYAISTLRPNQAETTGTFQANTLLAEDTQTGGLATDSIREKTALANITMSNDVLMSNNNLKQVNSIATDNIGVNIAGEIQSSASINMGGFDLQNVNNVYTDNIFENTLGNDVVVHNTLNMNNNHIHNLADPTQNKDGANKQYVDTAVAGGISNPLTIDLDGGGFKCVNFSNPSQPQDLATKDYVDTAVGGGGVQNPMIANLDAGGFSVYNASVFGTQSTTGRIESRGLFTHGYGTAGEFAVNGTDIRFAPSNNFTIENFGGTTTYFDYEQSSQILTTQNGAVQAIDTGSKLTFSGGGTLQLHLNPVVANQNEELSLLDINGGENQILQTQGNSNSVPNIPQSLNPIAIFNLNCDDVSIYAPFTSGLGWDNTSDGLTILLPDNNSITGKYGEPAGLNNNQVNCFPFNSYLCGVGINNASANGGWVCNGSSSLELVYTLTGLIDQSFVPPIYVAQAGAGLGFNQENIQIPKTSWIYADRLIETGITLSLKLNIPAGSTIDIQDPLNARVNCNKVQVAIIDML